MFEVINRNKSKYLSILCLSIRFQYCAKTSNPEIIQASASLSLENNDNKEEILRAQSDWYF
jgi:hypothetical protein